MKLTFIAAIVIAAAIYYFGLVNTASVLVIVVFLDMVFKSVEENKKIWG